MQDHIIFYGRKDGNELDIIYDYCDLAAACFGFHRIGAKLSSNLKSREYLAKGLPIISSVDIDVLQVADNTKYFLKVPYDDTPINIEEIIKFYDQIYQGKTRLEIASEIRHFAKGICDINVVLKPVVDYFAPQ